MALEALNTILSAGSLLVIAGPRYDGCTWPKWIDAHKNGAYPRGLPRFRDIDTG